MSLETDYIVVMPNLDLPILVVDDAKFSSTIIAKTLSKAGYRDLRVANDAKTALKQIEQRKASVLIADWLMPEMDGLELTQHVRQLDEADNHFTYIILLTAKESPEALRHAFEQSIDDFVSKSEMSKQLLPRVFAADRMADQQNTLLLANQLLIDNNRDLKHSNVIDRETGIGNLRYAKDSLTKQLKHTEARGGVTSYLCLDIQHWGKIKQEFSHIVCEELASSVSRRLRSLIRPLDVLCRVREDQYVVVAQFSKLEYCTASVYKRILDGVNLKSFRTSSGFHSVCSNIGVCCIDDAGPIPSVDEVEKHCEQLVAQARETSTISISNWRSSDAAQAS